MKSNLSIQEIPTTNPNTLLLRDTSFYETEPLDNVLEITVPNGTAAVLFKVKKAFYKVLNSSNLKILPAKNVDDLIPLIDGVYFIKYSVKPNKYLFAEYNLFRNTSQIGIYNREIAKLFLDKPSIPLRDFDERLRKLNWIKELIDASKILVEDHQKIKEGIELYNEASDLLKKLDKYTEC